VSLEHLYSCLIWKCWTYWECATDSFFKIALWLSLYVRLFFVFCLSVCGKLQSSVYQCMCVCVCSRVNCGTGNFTFTSSYTAMLTSCTGMDLPSGTQNTGWNLVMCLVSFLVTVRLLSITKNCNKPKTINLDQIYGFRLITILISCATWWTVICRLDKEDLQFCQFNVSVTTLYPTYIVLLP